MHFSTYRIIDANLNRLREGLRVIEEFCRFIFENQNLSSELKDIRHEIVQIAKSVGWEKENLLSHRDTEEDVGVKNSTLAEYQRINEKEILLANFSRVQESFRVLEEYGKTQKVGHLFEQLRYRTYTLEKNMMQMFICHNLQENIYILLTKSLCKNDYFLTIDNLCRAGVRLFQIREKDCSDAELFTLTKKAVDIIKSYGGTTIVNDRVDIAIASGADGVHLGVDDMPILEVRKMASRPFLIGATVHSLNELNQLPLESVDYIGVGPCFPTTTKPSLIASGIPLVASLIAQNKIPAFAIGGISLQNFAEVKNSGIKKIALCSSIISNENPVKIYQQFVSYMTDQQQSKAL
jgi:thiamine-phosphate pyrophosphorylase